MWERFPRSELGSNVKSADRPIDLFRFGQADAEIDVRLRPVMLQRSRAHVLVNRILQLSQMPKRYAEPIMSIRKIRIGFQCASK